MKMYADYLKEREGFELLFSGEGFASYRIGGEECYIRDIYIKPEHRKGGNAAYLADCISKLAREKGAKYLTGTVSPQKNGATESIKVLLAYGMKFVSSAEDRLVFMKEL